MSDSTGPVGESAHAERILSNGCAQTSGHVVDDHIQPWNVRLRSKQEALQALLSEQSLTRGLLDHVKRRRNEKVRRYPYNL